MKRTLGFLAAVLAMAPALGLAPGLAGGARAAVRAPRPGGATAPTERSWQLPRDEPELPKGPGRQEFYAACATCHSTRYVTDQPGFERAVWAAEVEKMRKSYGAEVPEKDVDAIVGYLMAVNGAAAAAGDR